MSRETESDSESVKRALVTETHVVEMFGAILTAALLGLAGWVYTVGNRVTALETRQESIELLLNDIHEQVDETNRFLRDNMVRRSE